VWKNHLIFGVSPDGVASFNENRLCSFVIPWAPGFEAPEFEAPQDAGLVDYAEKSATKRSQAVRGVINYS